MANAHLSPSLDYRRCARRTHTRARNHETMDARSSTRTSRRVCRGSHSFVRVGGGALGKGTRKYVKNIRNVRSRLSITERLTIRYLPSGVWAHTGDTQIQARAQSAVREKKVATDERGKSNGDTLAHRRIPMKESSAAHSRSRLSLPQLARCPGKQTLGCVHK